LTSGADRCVLCLRAGHPITREHVFAHWLVRRVHGGRLLASDPSSTVPPRIAGVITGVCAECNAGWMSSLEMSFRRAAFTRPRVGAVPAPNRVTLSRWFTKIAVLLAHARGGELAGAAHRAQLVSGMPDDIEVFLARQRRPRQRLDFALDVTANPETDTSRIRSAAILVDELVAHVAPRGTLASSHGTRLWPLRTHTLRWETLPVITPLVVPPGGHRAGASSNPG
jgi:hypothetical protein